jgi:hypothetical protein
MLKEKGTSPSRSGYVVLRHDGKAHWRLIGEAERKPGMTARAARLQAIQDATGGTVKEGEVYAAILRSEWRIAREY